MIELILHPKCWGRGLVQENLKFKLLPFCMDVQYFSLRGSYLIFCVFVWIYILNVLSRNKQTVTAYTHIVCSEVT